jgi:hypothetical protein
MLGGANAAVIPVGRSVAFSVTAEWNEEMPLVLIWMILDEFRAMVTVGVTLPKETATAGSSINAALTALETPPPVAVRAKVLIPGATADDAVNLIVPVPLPGAASTTGTMLEKIPAGRPVTAKLTGELKPPQRRG